MFSLNIQTAISDVIPSASFQAIFKDSIEVLEIMLNEISTGIHNELHNFENNIS